MKSTDGRLRGWEKANQGNLWECIRRQNRETHTFFTLVGTGKLVINYRDGKRGIS